MNHFPEAIRFPYTQSSLLQDPWCLQNEVRCFQPFMQVLVDLAHNYSHSQPSWPSPPHTWLHVENNLSTYLWWTLKAWIDGSRCHVSSWWASVFSNRFLPHSSLMFEARLSQRGWAPWGNRSLSTPTSPLKLLTQISCSEMFSWLKALNLSVKELKYLNKWKTDVFQTEHANSTGDM